MVISFFFKQKTAYEMRISDWSSNVCSSDLLLQDRVDAACKQIQAIPGRDQQAHQRRGLGNAIRDPEVAAVSRQFQDFRVNLVAGEIRAQRVQGRQEIGSASCRERGCQKVEISLVSVSLNKNNNATTH